MNIRPARILRVMLSEHDRYQGRPLHEAIVARCRQLGIAGATVFRGLEGYGETADIRRAQLLSHDLPLVVHIVDTAENIARLAPEIEAMMDKGLLAVSEVEMIRVQKTA